MRGAGWWWVVALVVVATKSPASAQDDEAHGLYEAGAAAFSSGHYDDALGHFQRAYELSHRPELLFNIGQAADRARHDETALEAFRAYLAARPDVENRAEIEGRVHVLEAAVAARSTAPPAPESTLTSPPQASPAPPTAATAPDYVPTQDPEVLDVGGVVLATTGGVLALTGAVLLGVGAPDLGPPRDGETYAQTTSRQQTAQALAGSGGVALGLGLIGAIVSAVMLVTFDARGSQRSWRLTPDGLETWF